MLRVTGQKSCPAMSTGQKALNLKDEECEPWPNGTAWNGTWIDDVNDTNMGNPIRNCTKPAEPKKKDWRKKMVLFLLMLCCCCFCLSMLLAGVLMWIRVVFQ